MPNRDEEGGLPPDAIVIRAGHMEIAMMTDSLQSHWDKHHDIVTGACRDESRHLCWSLSMNSAAGVSVADLARTANHNHARIRVSTVGAVEDAGWSIEPTPGSATAHCDVYLPVDATTEPTWLELVRLQRAFSEPIRNPAKGTP